MDTTMNTNMKELNLNEMEMINGGWNWETALVCIIPSSILSAAFGTAIAGVPGGVVGAGLGLAVSFS